MVTEKITYLIMVTDCGNHNKYYKMIPHYPKQNQFTAEYGRVGAKKMQRIYSMGDWENKYQEKIRKGYEDKTDLHCDVISSSISNKFKPIDNPVIESLVTRLQRYADKKLQAAYKITSKEVTQNMIDEANHLIYLLSQTSNISEFNNMLLKLFSVIPRRMSKVSDCLITDKKDIPGTLQDEQDLLDVMAAKVSQNQKSSHSGQADTSCEKKSTILEEYGIDIRECTDEEIQNIKKHLGKENLPKFKKAYRVVNNATENAFNNYVKKHRLSKNNIHFYYHGSKNENFWGILTEGLKLNPNAVITGKMFGHGIYFAPLAKKSINYTSLDGSYWAHGNSNTGFLAVYKVAYRKPYNIYSWNSRYMTFTNKDMIANKTDAVFAHKGSMLVNDEIIIYQEQQATLRYLIELEK